MAFGRRGQHMTDLPASDPNRRAQLKSRGRVTWHLKKAEQGPASLALKNHFIAMIGEYVGTVLFMIFALGGTNVALIPATSLTGDTTAGQDGSAASTVNTSNLLYIALSFGFSLAVNAWIFFRVSGGLFNPAVSLGMVLVGALTPLRGALLTFSQILGGITGSAIIQAVTPGTLNVRTQLGGGTSIAQGLFLEMFLTSLLMLAILLLAAEKHKATFIAPIGIGLALFVAELLGVYYTGGSLNPARSFGPAVVLRSFNGYHWIYWLGPALGATIAAGFYKMLKWLQYETVLGPETDEPTRPAPPGTIVNSTTAPAHHDEEKATESAGRTLAVSGPGLGDLLTEGPTEAVFDLQRRPGPLEHRLDRIEAILAQLAESRPRRSQSTYFDESQNAATTTTMPKKNVEYDAPVAARHMPTDNQHGTNGYATNDTYQDGRVSGLSGNAVAVPHIHDHGEGHALAHHGAAGAGNREHVDIVRR
ncbi:hypothetical protein IAU60_002948 [Kwoniella sp. DSM 27419]